MAQCSLPVEMLGRDEAQVEDGDAHPLGVSELIPGRSWPPR
jgi:hypothetical protein